MFAGRAITWETGRRLAQIVRSAGAATIFRGAAARTPRPARNRHTRAAAALHNDEPARRTLCNRFGGPNDRLCQRSSDWRRDSSAGWRDAHDFLPSGPGAEWAGRNQTTTTTTSAGKPRGWRQARAHRWARYGRQVAARFQLARSLAGAQLAGPLGPATSAQLASLLSTLAPARAPQYAAAAGADHANKTNDYVILPGAQLAGPANLLVG